MSRPDWPLDRALERLRAHRLPYKWHPTELSRWDGVCPSCRVEGSTWTLILRERGRGGAVDLRCVAGCDAAEIAATLARDPAEARIEAAELRVAEALEIAEQARDVASRALGLAGARVEPVELARAA